MFAPTNRHFLGDIDENQKRNFVKFIHGLISKEAALIPKVTSELTLEYDQSRLFRYPVENLNRENFEVFVENLKGEVEISFLFDESDEFESYEIKKKIISFSKRIEVPKKSKNLFINAKAIEDKCLFKIRIK